MQKNKAQERKLKKKEGKRLIKLVETAKSYVFLHSKGDLGAKGIDTSQKICRGCTLIALVVGNVSAEWTLE